MHTSVQRLAVGIAVTGAALATAVPALAIGHEPVTTLTCSNGRTVDVVITPGGGNGFNLVSSTGEFVAMYGFVTNPDGTTVPIKKQNGTSKTQTIVTCTYHSPSGRDITA